MTWVYQITQREKGGNNILNITGYWCDEYVLTFDQRGVLRDWAHKSQKHRDPPSRADCVTNGFMSKRSSFNLAVAPDRMVVKIRLIFV
jgi:hypothetical protein